MDAGQRPPSTWLAAWADRRPGRHARRQQLPIQGAETLYQALPCQAALASQGRSRPPSPPTLASQLAPLASGPDGHRRARAFPTASRPPHLAAGGRVRGRVHAIREGAGSDLGSRPRLLFWGQVCICRRRNQRRRQRPGRPKNQAQANVANVRRARWRRRRGTSARPDGGACCRRGRVGRHRQADGTHRLLARPAAAQERTAGLGGVSTDCAKQVCPATPPPPPAAPRDSGVREPAGR